MKLGEHRPGKMPIALVFRPKTGCRQYCFYSAADINQWARRKPYCNETIMVYRVGDGARLTVAAGEADAITDFLY